MRPVHEIIKEKPWIAWAVFFGTLILVFIIGLFAASIMERRTEALIAYTPTNNLSDFDPRNAKWGEFFPREYQTWLRTQDQDFKSKYNGNKHIDMLEEDPNLVILWAGYGFAKDYNQPKGHFYSVSDIRKTLRTGAPTLDNKNNTMPNTCWTCKSPDVPRVMAEVGVAEFYKGKWSTRGHEVVNPIGCADCHDPKTMNLRISRPALIEAFQRMGKDIKKASHQDMRSLVCAQCHVEYYFKGDGKYLTFPWDDGMSVEAMEKYYDQRNFKDWTHKLSKAPMLKTQHPGYEMFKMGIHGQRGLSCADCHMPYASEGGVKYTNHQIVSPLKHIEKTCQVCHRESEEELRRVVYERQDKIAQLKDKAEELLVKAHIEAKKAWDLGANEVEMKPILTNIRHSQWRWDYAVAAHGNAFHAPLETSRVLSSAIDKAHEARMKLIRVLAKYGFNEEVKIPDISTKHKAQEYIGFDYKKHQAA